MQCANCRFENMPGLQMCGRCGASLQLAALAIDVHPPRASAWAKRSRRVLPPGRLGIRRRLGVFAQGLTGLRITDVPAAPVLLRMVVPGWPQAHLGHERRGRWFLGTYLGCLVPGLLMAGSPLGSVLLGLAVATHLSSVLDIVLAGAQESRVARAILCCGVVAGVVYLPFGWLASQVASPRRILQPVGPFARGDVVLVNSRIYRWRQPAPGDVVLYDVVPFRIPGRTVLGGNAVLAVGGERIDRILAGPGQTLQIKEGRLTVDGQAVVYSALNPARLPATLKVEVPENSYLILPTTAVVDRFDLQQLDWHLLSVVPAEQVIGKVWLRHHPVWRFWWIR
jgi:signal peptidase I